MQLPPIITLNDFGGDIHAYFKAVYNIFHEDFIKSRPVYRGVRLALKKYPIIEEMEYTFYHFTHDGDIETDRSPNLRRMERMPYPRPMIDNSTDASLKVWINTRKKKRRILIFHEMERYLVVLEDRGEFILPWTAYLVDYGNQKDKLINEYNEYIKVNGIV